MSKDQNNTISLPVETVENLVKSLEWIICSINFWHIDKEYPMNLIMKVSAYFMYELRSYLTKNKLKNCKKLNKKIVT